jgi:CheY-like chemotaxis protein
MPLAKREQPDVILLNVNLPGPNGWQVAEELLKDEETRQIPIVFLTARAAFSDRARGFDIGAVDYITKPFNPVELAPRLRGLLERLERGERDALRREKISELRPLTALAIALQAQVAKAQGTPPEAPAPITEQTDAIADMQRLVAQQLERQGPLLSEYVARDLLGHVSTLRLTPPAIDLERERAVDQAAEDIRVDASECESTGVDSGTRRFLRDLPENERRNIRETLAALILAIANYVFDHHAEKANGRSLIRLVTVLYVLMALYNAVTRAIDAVDGEDEDTHT